MKTVCFYFPHGHWSPSKTPEESLNWILKEQSCCVSVHHIVTERDAGIYSPGSPDAFARDLARCSPFLGGWTCLTAENLSGSSYWHTPRLQIESDPGQLRPAVYLLNHVFIQGFVSLVTRCYCLHPNLVLMWEEEFQRQTFGSWIFSLVSSLCWSLLVLSPGVSCYLPSLPSPVPTFLTTVPWLPKRSAYRYSSSDITLCITCLQFEDGIGLNLTEIGLPLLWTSGNSVLSLGRVRT